MAIHGDLLLEAWMDPGKPGTPGLNFVTVTLVYIMDARII